MPRIGPPGPPSARLIALLAGDLAGWTRATGDDGGVHFVSAGGISLDVASRIERRFLGRTEVAVFEADLGVQLPERATMKLGHSGRVKRTGLTVKAASGGGETQRIAEALASDEGLCRVLMPLDFTRFEVNGDQLGSRVTLELMGASHVAIALPPVRSYVHLHADQREAMIGSIEATRRALEAAVSPL